MLRERLTAVKADLKAKTRPSGWVLPREPSSFAEEGTWTNIDCDVTPIERRTWTSWTVLGFWFSDALNAQGWMAPASIIALGLTWREAIVCIIFGSFVCTVPLVLNGMIGARLHIPFPVAMRASFGWYFSRFAVVTRAVTALFWHAIQTYTGSTAMTQIIRSIWPSYLDIPNHIPESIGVTTQGMVSHLIFWSLQFPILLIPPHKLKWFFLSKCVLVLVSSVAVVITMTRKAGGTGDIWNLPYGVSGETRSWLILSSLSSITGGWATMSTNIPDFTRYLRSDKGVYWQVLFLPAIQLVLGIFGIICCSCSKVVYGEYIWDPLELAAKWDGPAGRCGAFWVGLTWVVAQIGTNLSANVISCANDLTCLFPKYINIKRGVILATITAAWIMQPWKIVYSAASLMNFMSGLGIFLAPIAAILGADYWVTHKQKLDVPGLYRAHGRYRYNKYGTNWRAVIALLVSVVPNLPGMAASVNSSLAPSVGGAEKIYYMFYLWGYSSAFVIYILLSYFFPETHSQVAETIHGDQVILEAAMGELDSDSQDQDEKTVEPRVAKEDI
ncbi:Allantoin permease [Pleurostoma richardsiae]|uniref:Allantoin permease n=1 Tax=Pleurostoma richardsiae TaxID=41990 RepID=A0AA38RF33_9PEZI|nr:Allantoin permease [Pleurostoma richardsiae]